MKKKYNLSVKVFYHLVLILKKADINLKNTEDTQEISRTILNAISNTQQETINLVSLISGKTFEEIENIDALEYIDIINEFIKDIDWDVLMGKLTSAITDQTNQKEA